MPKVEGGVEKINRRSRVEHISHRFLGIYDVDFRKKGVDIDISAVEGGLDVKLRNRMGHPLIIQPARVKYLNLKVVRGDRTIYERNSTFELIFRDKSGSRVTIPANAYSVESRNLDENETKIIRYRDIDIRGGDSVIATLYVRFAKSDCLKVIDLEDRGSRRGEGY